MIRTSSAVHEYAGKQIQVGDMFEVEHNHVALLLAIGRIEPEEGEPGYEGTKPRSAFDGIEKPQAQSRPEGFKHKHKSRT